MKYNNICAFCDHKNRPENWGCDNCGAPLDLEISYNEFDLPEITNR
jgi:hypothetical protein